MTFFAPQTLLMTFGIIGGGIFVLMAYSAFLGYSTAQIVAGHPRVRRFQWHVLGFTFLWAALFGFETMSVNAAEMGLGFPITVIPLFLGLPFGILIHISAVGEFSLERLAKISEDAATRSHLLRKK